MHRFDDGREVQASVRGQIASLRVWGALIPLGIAAASAIGSGISNAKKNSAANQDRQLNRDQFTFEQEKYNQRDPFRQYALQSLAHAEDPVNSQSIFQGKGNPFAANFDYAKDLGANRNPNVMVGQTASADPQKEAKLRAQMEIDAFLARTKARGF